MTSNKSHEKAVQEIPQHGFFGHPKGLGVLFFVEFWERFSYYGMRAMLIFYMYFALQENGLGMDKTTAMSIMSVYGSLIYMSSIPGGWIADRITGTRGATLIGAILIIIGHICLSLPFAMVGLFTSMFFIIVGSGLMKPNISNIVGRLYPENDVRMDAGFVIFYMSVNMGALVSPIILQHYIDIRNPLSSSEKKKYGTIIGIVVIAIVLILMIAYFTHTLSFNLISNTVLILGIALPIIYFTTMIRSKEVTDTERSRVKAFIPLFILGMLFWSIQEQGSNVLNIYGIENSDMKLNLFGWKTHFGEAIFQTINPLFILLFAPVVTLLWQKLGKKQPSLPIKFAIGTILAGASYILMGAIGHIYGDTQFSVNWVILSYVICVIGELCLSPTGSSAAVKLAPKAFNAQMMS
ncbi:MAG: oligopeptide:H+ symporter, partial [Staphylococcus epidermidis]|nr:oligopeptide:H+ symporter [Staphylococcus epidermidis]